MDLLKENIEIIHGEIPVRQGGLDLSLINNDTMLRTKITKREKINELGIEFTAKVEDWMIVESSGKKFVLKPTRDVVFFIYTADPVKGYAGIFAKGKYLTYILKAITNLLETPEWFKEITFNLHENEEAIRKEFGNFRRFYTRDMDHELVKTATLIGIKLEDSPDYKRYLDDYGGYLSALFLSYGDLEFMISSRGRIWSPSKEFEKRKYHIIKDIIERLEKIGVIQNSQLSYKS